MSLVDLTVKGGMPLDNDGALSKGLVDNMYSSTSPISNNSSGIESSVDLAHAIGTSMLSQDTPRNGQVLRSQQHITHARQGRMSRKETCFVNAAIMARSYDRGPKRFNKPIVVDLDLPIWHEEDVVLEEERRSPSYPHADTRYNELSGRPVLKVSFQGLTTSTDDSSDSRRTSSSYTTDTTESTDSSEKTIHNYHLRS